jgi:hypothetical protein
MKKTYFISFIICALLSAACEQTDNLNLDTKSINTLPIQSISFQEGAKDCTGGYRKIHDIFTIVRSRAELNNVVSQRYYQYTTDASGPNNPINVYYLGDDTEQYDDVFFAENALVLYLFTSPNRGGKIDITRVQRQGDELTIIKDFHGGSLTALGYWTVVIEVAQADVDGITALKTKNECNCPRFSFDMILVVLTPEATVAAYNAGKAYTPADFPEFEFSYVDNLFTTKPTSPDFCRILFLYLAEPSDKNVLTAVDLIGRRPDVKVAEPDYYFGF